MAGPILIATTSFEEHSYRPVCDKLAKDRVPFVLFLTDKVLEGADRFFMEISECGAAQVIYEGWDISPSATASGWYWKVNSFQVPGAEHNVSKQMTMVNEVTQMQNSIWSVYQDSFWLNSPLNVWRAERKFAQLLLACRVGFSTPRTLVGSHWEDTGDRLLETHDPIVVKMARGVLADQNVVKGMNTTLLEPRILDELRDRALPFPGIYQPFIDKAREWRVTVVGEDVFAACIYTSAEARVDWRRHQVSSAVRFSAEPLCEEVAAKCIAFLKGMDLHYGAFDLIETPGGEMVFLECNPSGQFSWLEERLQLPISRSIANHLIRLASS